MGKLLWLVGSAKDWLRWPVQRPREKVLRSIRIWPWWLDRGLGDACYAGLVRLTRAKACLGLSGASNVDAFEHRFHLGGIAEVLLAPTFVASRETLDPCDRMVTMLWHRIPSRGLHLWT